MDIFTDVDIFKEIVNATLRGVAVYILLDDSHFDSFLNMTHRVGIDLQDLKVRNILYTAVKCNIRCENMKWTKVISLNSGRMYLIFVFKMKG